MDAWKSHASRGAKPRLFLMFIADANNSPSLRNKLLKWGWIDSKGRSLPWNAFHRPNHNDQFDEPRERKARKQKFVPKKYAPQEPR